MGRGEATPTSLDLSHAHLFLSQWRREFVTIPTGGLASADVLVPPLSFSPLDPLLKALAAWAVSDLLVTPTA